MKKMLTVLALVAAFVFPASAAEMYYNRLSAGEVLIPAGTYGDIVVPEGGYKATQFPSALGTISEATGDYGGSYAGIIGKFGSNCDLADHTISGWFRVPTNASGETTLCVEKTSSSYANSRGNAIRVSADGHLVVGKIKSTDAWQDDSTHITSADKVPTNEWFYLTVSFTVDHAARTATAKAYTNGVAIAMPPTAFACNYNGTSCAAIKVGDNVECAGLRVDDAVVDDTAAMKAWAVDSKYLVQPVLGECVWTGSAGDGDPTNGKNWEGGVAPVKNGPFTHDLRLEARADWCGAAVPSANGVTVDLNGQTLKVTSFSPFAGATIVDASEGDAKGTLGVDDGMVRLETGTTIPAGATLALGGTATLDANGKGGKFKVVMANGATVANTGGAMAYNVEQLSGGLVLEAGATVHVSPKNEMSSTNRGYAEYSVNMNGGTIVKGNAGKWGVVHVNFTNGGRVVVEKGEFNIGRKGFACEPGFVIEAKKDSSAFVWVQGACTVPTIVGDGYVASDSAALAVTNRLSGLIALGKADGTCPFTASKKLTLKGGATLDLTGNETTYVPQANFAFGEGTITVDVAGRTLAKGDKVIAWDKVPANVTFQWDATTAKKGIPPVVALDGLYYGANPASKEVDKGYWTGAKDGNPLDAANWACTNLAGYAVEGAVPTNAAASVVIPNPLARDLDWRALGAVNFAADAVVDINGHVLTLAAFGVNNAGFITNGVSAVGKVRLDIGAGQTSSLGAGFMGGNVAIDILSGTFKLTQGGIVWDEAVLITVSGGATLDENGAIDTPVRVRMEDGATLTNTGVGRAENLAQFTGGLEVADGATAYIDTVNEMALTSSSYDTMMMNIGTGTLVKRGKGKISIQNGDITGTGMIRVEAGELNIGSRGLDIEDAITIEVVNNATTDTFLWIQSTCAVPRIAGDGRIAADGASLTVTKSLSGRLQLGLKSGKYPFASGHLTLGDGATLDLTAIEGAWVQPARVVFGENAKVTVDLTGRAVHEGDKIIAWNALPTPLAKLRPTDAVFYFVRKADGLYAAESSAIFVR